MKNNFLTYLGFHPGHRGIHRAQRERGQSMVELALTLPLLLTIIAGTVEVTNVLTVYNEVQLAAREGARFASQGGSDTGLMNVIQQAGTNMLNPSQMTVWVVRPKIDTTPSPWIWKGGSTTAWGVTENCVYPTGCSATSPVTPNRVLTYLGTISGAQAAGIDETTFAVVVISYQVRTLLNLPYFTSADGTFPIYVFTVFRQEVSTQAANQLTGGCSAYPIAIASDQIPSGVTEGTLITLSLNSTPSSVDGFAFLAWRIGQEGSPATYLTGSSPSGALRPPGNSLNATYGYQQYDGVGTDTTLHRANWVLASTGNMSTANMSTLLDSNITSTPQRTLRVIVYNPMANVNPGLYDYGSGQRWMYRADAFIIVRIDARTSSSITFEFVRVDASCGFTS